MPQLVQKSARRYPRMLLIATMAIAVVLLAVACGGDDDSPPAPTTPPGNGSPVATPTGDAPGTPTAPPATGGGALRDAWSVLFSDLEDVRREHGIASVEYGEAFDAAVAELRVLMPQEMPIPEVMSSDGGGVGGGNPGCHGGEALSLMVRDPDASPTSFQPWLSYEDAIAWFESETAAAGWSVTSNEWSPSWAGDDYEGMEFHLSGFGDEWRVLVDAPFATNISYCPAER